MLEQSMWVPDDVDVDIPSSARIYDYVLGGGHNFEADRLAAEELLSVIPAGEMARLNRSYLRRAVLYLCNAGIRQFLDLGSGIPTVGNVHEVAQNAVPSSRVLYVDIDPIAVAHSKLLLSSCNEINHFLETVYKPLAWEDANERALVIPLRLLTGNQNADAVRGDLRRPDDVLASAEAAALLNLQEPLGLLMVGVMQFVADSDNPWEIVAGYRKRLASGSYLALSHFTGDGMPQEMAQAVEVFAKTREPAHPRTHEQILRMFEGFHLVEPGLVYTGQWHPESPDEVGDHPHRSNLYAGVGRLL